MDNNSENHTEQQPTSENMTLSWIWEHVPIKWFVGLVVISFGAGFSLSEGIKITNANATEKLQEKLQEKILSLNEKNRVLTESEEKLRNMNITLSDNIDSELRQREALEKSNLKLALQLKKALNVKEDILRDGPLEKELFAGEEWTDSESGITLSLVSVSGTVNRNNFDVEVITPNSKKYRKKVKVGTTWKYYNNGRKYKAVVKNLSLENMSIQLVVNRT